MTRSPLFPVRSARPGDRRVAHGCTSLHNLTAVCAPLAGRPMGCLQDGQASGASNMTARLTPYPCAGWAAPAGGGIRNLLGPLPEQVTKLRRLSL